MEEMIILSKEEDQKKREIARIIREETSYSVCRDDVELVSRDATCSIYSAKLVIANENGKVFFDVEIICKVYQFEKKREIILIKKR